MCADEGQIGVYFLEKVGSRAADECRRAGTYGTPDDDCCYPCLLSEQRCGRQVVGDGGQGNAPRDDGSCSFPHCRAAIEDDTISGFDPLGGLTANGSFLGTRDMG